MKLTNRLILSAALLPLGWAAACGSYKTTSPASAPPSLPADVEALRATLAPFTSLNLAKSAGYNTALTDCMSNGDLGAMGIHFGNTALIDGTADPLHPVVERRLDLVDRAPSFVRGRPLPLQLPTILVKHSPKLGHRVPGWRRRVNLERRGKPLRRLERAVTLCNLRAVAQRPT